MGKETKFARAEVAPGVVEISAEIFSEEIPSKR